jgi:adenylate kinase
MSSVNTQPKLKVHVLCSGLRYGKGEDAFYEIFKSAWLYNYIYYKGKGDNLVPTIHITDLARLVQRIVNDKPNHPYIFAVDRTKKPTIKRIFETICKGIGNGTNIQGYDGNSISDFGSPHDVYAYMTLINLKMKCSIAFKDKEPSDDSPDPEEEAKLGKFNWHCEGGIIDNIKRLNDEFNHTRQLNPVKIFITGPPASGKTTNGLNLAYYYNIPLIEVNADLVSKALELAKKEDEDADEFCQEIKATIEDLKDKMVAKIEEERPED